MLCLNSKISRKTSNESKNTKNSNEEELEPIGIKAKQGIYNRIINIVANGSFINLTPGTSG